MTEERRSTSANSVLVYDGQCRLCVTAKEGLARLGIQDEAKAVRLIPYQSEEAKRALGAAYRPGRPDVAFLVRPDGIIQEGLEAFLPLLPGLKGGRFLATIFSVPLVKPVAYLIYRLVARYRYSLFGEVPYTDPSEPIEKRRPDRGNSAR